MLRKIMLSEMPRTRKLVLPKTAKKHSFVRGNRLSLPYAKELETNHQASVKNRKVASYTQEGCSYEYDPCAPLFP